MLTGHEVKGKKKFQQIVHIFIKVTITNRLDRVFNFVLENLPSLVFCRTVPITYRILQFRKCNLEIENFHVKSKKAENFGTLFRN
jgi:hypothetical protein